MKPNVSHNGHDLPAPSRDMLGAKKPPPVTLRKGRKVRLRWEHGHARIDDRVYYPPKKASPVKITFDDCGLRVLVPELPAQPD
jgi:hypothetical protein